ncbi:MAG TPA: phosphatase PAP2 family protein [Xanthobacteraceae bacterium]|nr:phosphatase PAP2 family protein [Xanthobacteraceae bacterium]
MKLSGVPPEEAAAARRAKPLAGLPKIAGTRIKRTFATLAQWMAVVARPPRHALPRPPAIAGIVVVIGLAVVVASMFQFDTAASDWARRRPQWLLDAFEQITNFGLAGWFLVPFGIVLIGLAAMVSPALSRPSQGTLAALAARFGFLFLAIGAPGLFDTVVKRLIGRARPYVGGHDDPFSYVLFVWRPEYAAMPSGHATTAAAAAIAIGAIWPRARVAMWLYALVIMFSRVVILAHHPSDVIAGALVGAIGALLVRRWFAARGLVFSAISLHAYPWPSSPRVWAALREAMHGW